MNAYEELDNKKYYITALRTRAYDLIVNTWKVEAQEFLDKDDNFVCQFVYHRKRIPLVESQEDFEINLRATLGINKEEAELITELFLRGELMPED